MRKALLTVALAAFMALSVFPASATHSASQDYLISGGVGVTVAGRILGNNVGGATFDPVDTGELPVSVTIADESGGAVSWTVCQDANDDSVCGDAGEPRVDGCSTGSDLTGSDVPFDVALQSIVFISTAAVDCPDALATGGTVTLTYGSPIS